MKRSYLLVLILAIGMSGCGSNTIDGFTESNSSVEVEKIAITIACTTPVTVDDYIELKSGDKIVKDEEGSEIKLYHDENNLKSICLENGIAHIERAISQ